MPKRRRAAAAHTADADLLLRDLQQRINEETAVLQDLEAAIDDAATDDEQPVQPRGSSAAAQQSSPAMPQGQAHSMRMHAGCFSEGTADAEAAGLRARAKRERDKRRKQRRKDASGFSLAAVNEDMAAFVAACASEGPLELPQYSKMQRLQVRFELHRYQCQSSTHLRNN